MTTFSPERTGGEGGMLKGERAGEANKREGRCARVGTESDTRRKERKAEEVRK